MTAIAVTIAGSDSSAGAGIQADLKTFAALGVYGASVITALTAQNTERVDAVHAVPRNFIHAQMRSVFTDLDVAAVKIGMLANRETILSVAQGLKEFTQAPVVHDPVMVAGSGDALLDPGAETTLREALLPLAALITPNIPEAAKLLGTAPASNGAEMEAQARDLVARGAHAVLLKGGHLQGATAIDIFYDGKELLKLEAPRIETESTHGTGCTLSAAIAAGLAKGGSLKDSVVAAKAFVSAAIAAADRLKIGKGKGPVHHFHALWPKGNPAP
jgi:hydroxymethylpyrimidine/phosphomethylpyrimidine kinase